MNTLVYPSTHLLHAFPKINNYSSLDTNNKRKKPLGNITNFPCEAPAAVLCMDKQAVAELSKKVIVLSIVGSAFSPKCL